MTPEQQKAHRRELRAKNKVTNAARKAELHAKVAERKAKVAARKAKEVERADRQWAKAHPAAPVPESGPAVQVVTYPTVAAFQRDAPARMAAGWTIAAQSIAPPTKHWAKGAGKGIVNGAIFGFPFAGALIGAKVAKTTEGIVTVTWQRQA
jgi:transcription elongation GreA/GreB family factor